MKELKTCIDDVKKKVSTGKIPPNLQKILEGKCVDEAVRTWEITRRLLAQLESRINELCDPKKSPQGSTHPCTHALDVFKELNITEDTCDMIMYATATSVRGWACIIFKKLKIPIWIESHAKGNQNAKFPGHKK
jgi:hypothetical protein